MELKLTLALPRDALSVPVVRQLLRASMQVLGVAGNVISDIELALTEAATNVLEHSQESDDYEVSAGIDGDRCVIEVVDRGQGFDGSAQGLDEMDGAAEGGRGIQLMRALVDRVEFTDRPTQGTVVHLEKRLEWRAGSVIDRWTDVDAGQRPALQPEDGRTDRLWHPADAEPARPAATPT